MSQPILVTRNLSKQYGRMSALRNITFSIEQGKMVLLFGPNGSGKTTLIRILATLCTPTSGEVEIAGQVPHTHGNQIHRSIGVVSHHSFLYPALTAYENLRFYAQMFDVDAAARQHIIEEALHTVGLTDRMHDLVRTFSRGMVQRLSIARLCLHDPPTLLLDEPYTGLDYEAVAMLQQLLQQFHAAGKTILVSTHLFQNGLEQCDEALVLKQGRLVFHGPARVVVSRLKEKSRRTFEP